MGPGDLMRSLDFHLHHRHYHRHHHHHHHHHQATKNNRQPTRDVPKGCLAINVGQGAETQRFVVPVVYFNHALFQQLLKEAEEEFGFEQKGTITLPCRVDEFQRVCRLIDRDKSIRDHHRVGCFGP